MTARLIMLAIVLFYTIIGAHTVIKTGHLRPSMVVGWRVADSIALAILIWLWPVLLFITIGDAVHDAYVAPDTRDTPANRRNYE